MSDRFLKGLNMPIPMTIKVNWLTKTFLIRPFVFISDLITERNIRRRLKNDRRNQP
jgi:hypothetical protein